MTIDLINQAKAEGFDEIASILLVPTPLDDLLSQIHKVVSRKAKVVEILRKQGAA